jgi:hypothetical protein
MKPTFKTKDEYLQWRAEWRARYKVISHDIRHLRLLNAARQSGLGLPKWDRSRPALLEIQKRLTNKDTGIFNLFYWLWSLRKEAAQMLEWRKESKPLAQQQYLATRQAYQTNPGACSSPA